VWLNGVESCSGKVVWKDVKFVESMGERNRAQYLSFT